MNVSFEMIALPQSPVLVEPGLAQHQTEQLLSMRLPEYSFGLKKDERHQYRWCSGKYNTCDPLPIKTQYNHGYGLVNWRC